LVSTTVVPTRSFAILQSKLDRRPYHQLIDHLSVCGVSWLKPRWNGIVPRHASGMEIRELTQREAIGDPFAKLTIVPIFYPHQHQRSQDLLRRLAASTGSRIFQITFQIAPDLRGHCHVNFRQAA
jgi:hypothetical protein